MAGIAFSHHAHMHHKTKCASFLLCMKPYKCLLRVTCFTEAVCQVSLYNYQLCNHNLDCTYVLRSNNSAHTKTYLGSVAACLAWERGYNPDFRKGEHVLSQNMTVCALQDAPCLEFVRQQSQCLQKDGELSYRLYSLDYLLHGRTFSLGVILKTGSFVNLTFK